MFFTYTQNNSFGKFILNDAVSHYVIIEALNSENANVAAVDLGLYFDGVRKGRDCPCCGDRWERAHQRDGTEEPEIFGEKVLQKLRRNPYEHIIIYFSNGAKLYLQSTKI